MPFIRAAILRADASPDLVEHLQSALSALAVDALGKVAGLVSVLVEPAPSGAWSVGGRRVGCAAHVAIAITAGTNTAEEKAAFVQRTHAILRALLGPDLPDATYVVVDEVAPDSWGYGGITAARRRLGVADQTHLVGASHP